MLGLNLLLSSWDFFFFVVLPQSWLSSSGQSGAHLTADGVCGTHAHTVYMCWFIITGFLLLTLFGLWWASGTWDFRTKVNWMYVPCTAMVGKDGHITPPDRQEGCFLFCSLFCHVKIFQTNMTVLNRLVLHIRRSLAQKRVRSMKKTRSSEFGF